MASTDSEPSLRAGSARARLVAVVNPTKVDDIATRRAWLVEQVEALDADIGWVETTAADPGTAQAAKAAADGATTVLSWGGDGTTRAVAEGLIDTGTALGIMPGGTGNLLARNLGIPLDLSGALHVALHGTRRTIDVLEIGLGGQVTTSLVIAGLGLDAALMEAPENAKARIGFAAYGMGLARGLRRGHLRAGISVDGEAPRWVTARTILVANTGGLVAGLDIAAEAEMDDGLLDVVILKLRTPRDWGVAIGSLVRARATTSDSRIHLRGSRVQIVTREPQNRQVDGDLVGAGSTLRARVRPGALVVRVPVTQ